jgi:hypothetical protein
VAASIGQLATQLFTQAVAVAEPGHPENLLLILTHWVQAVQDFPVKFLEQLQDMQVGAVAARTVQEIPDTTD